MTFSISLSPLALARNHLLNGVSQKAEQRIFSTLRAYNVIYYIIKFSAEENDTKNITFG